MRIDNMSVTQSRLYHLPPPSSQSEIIARRERRISNMKYGKVKAQDSN